MENFSEFIRDFCVIAISGGLIMLMSPNGKLKNHVKFIISLCMVCALLSALVSAPAQIEEYLKKLEVEIEENGSAGGEEARLEIAKAAKKNLEAEAATLLCSHLGFSEDAVYVVATLNTENLEAVEITQVTAFIEDFSKADVAKEYLGELFMNEVNIVIMEKG